MSELQRLIQVIRAYPGLTRKNPLAEIFSELVAGGPPGPQLPNYGDDAAVIPRNGEYLLLAADGIMTGLLVNEPYAAGKASVMVTVNDIYAMGGRPLALVNVLASGDDDEREQIVMGIKKGCAKLGVPMVGGHTHPDAPPGAPALSVAILGHAKALMRSHLARPGHSLVAAVDLSGRAGCQSVTSWDANSGKTTEELIHRLEALPRIAEAHLAPACKDVSNGGLVGTICIMLENSGCGGIIDLDALPRPGSLSLEAWLLSFMSYGFVFSAPQEGVPLLLEVFRQRGVEAAVVGRVDDGPAVRLMQGGKEAVLYDFNREAITGISRPK